MGKLQNNQKGFSAVEALLILVIVGIIGFAGWYVYHSRNNADKNYQAASNALTITKSQAKEPTPVGEQKDGDWTVVTTTNIALTQWGLKITLPNKLISKALYKYDPLNNIYVFALRSIVDDAKCSAYFRTIDNPVGIEASKYSSSTLAEGQVGTSATSTETLADYYTEHKSSSGDYFTETYSARNYYKIGDNFYVLDSDPPAFHQQHLSDFSAACSNIDPNWQQDFVNAMKSLSV